MKKRIIKKTAARYIASPKGRYLPFGTYKESFQAYNDGSPAVEKTFARFPWPVEKLIREKAEASGWDGCHWDDPLLISVDDTELREYEADYNPPHCW